MRSLPNTNINKFGPFVILVYLLLLGTTGCSLLSTSGAAAEDSALSAPYEKPVVSGKLGSPDLKEASGIAASKCQTNVFWTHNDSGDDALLYAIDSTGKHLGVWKVEGAANRDWEDIEAVRSGGKCYVFIAETGDNDRKYERIAVYRVEEPTVVPDGVDSSAKNPLPGVRADVAYINYPDEKHDAEALLAHPTSGEFYILTKSRSEPSHIYKFLPKFEGETQTLTKIGELTVPAIPNGTITGGDISADGKRVVLCDYFAGYELALPNGSRSFDEVWTVKPLRIDLGERAIGEAVAYSADGSFVIAVSEKKHTPVNIVRRKTAN
ncbi:MAG: hypothetical protein ABIR33_07450 [Pyrinomonadaceae bacterium]